MPQHEATPIRMKIFRLAESFASFCYLPAKHSEVVKETLDDGRFQIRELSCFLRINPLVYGFGVATQLNVTPGKSKSELFSEADDLSDT